MGGELLSGDITLIQEQREAADEQYSFQSLMKACVSFFSVLLFEDPLKSYFSVSNFVFMIQKVIPISNIVSKHM